MCLRQLRDHLVARAWKRCGASTCPALEGLEEAWVLRSQGQSLCTYSIHEIERTPLYGCIALHSSCEPAHHCGRCQQCASLYARRTGNRAFQTDTMGARSQTFAQ